MQTTVTVAKYLSPTLRSLAEIVTVLLEKYTKNGGKNGSSISSKTSYLLAGENMGPAKLKQATSLKVQILSEDEFIKLISSWKKKIAGMQQNPY